MSTYPILKLFFYPTFFLFPFSLPPKINLPFGRQGKEHKTGNVLLLKCQKQKSTEKGKSEKRILRPFTFERIMRQCQTKRQIRR